MIEIETALNRYIENECVAIFKNNKIICYIKTNRNVMMKSEDIFEFLKGVLPQYALPNNIFFIDNIPHNSNGKIDRLQLEQMVID